MQVLPCLAILEAHVVGVLVASDRRDLRRSTYRARISKSRSRLSSRRRRDTRNCSEPPTRTRGRSSRPGLSRRRPTDGRLRCCLQRSRRWSRGISTLAKRRYAIAGSLCPTRRIAVSVRLRFRQEPGRRQHASDMTMRTTDPHWQHNRAKQRDGTCLVPGRRPICRRPLAHCLLCQEKVNGCTAAVRRGRISMSRTLPPNANLTL